MPSIALPVSLRGQLLSGSRFNPISLFSAGEQGIWLDPSDLTTMFQDRAGTTPVTTPGQTVGLRLDKSKGLVLGSELVTNGDFSSDTWWTKGAGATISGGKANFSASSGYVLNRLGVSGIVTGGYYEVTFTVSDYVSGSIRPYLGSTPTFGTAVTANGTYTARFSPGSGTEVGFNSASAFTGSIDNVSIKAITGNHAVAPTDAARPIYGVEPKGGRRNLLTWSEDLTNNTAWVKANVTVPATQYLAPDSTTTAELLYPTSSGTNRFAYQALSSASNIYTGSVYAKASGKNFLCLDITGGGASAYFDLSAGTVGTVSAGYTASIQSVGSGWHRCSIRNTSSSAFSFAGVYGVTDADNSRTVTANGTDGILLWGAQFEAASAVSAYQRVASAYDVTESGVVSCHYVQYDGSDDSLSTAAIDFTATDKMSVFAGVRKITNGNNSCIVELSAVASSNSGAFCILTGRSTFGPAPAYAALSTGTTGDFVNTADLYDAPISNLLSLLGDISGDTAKLRVNGTQVAQSTSNQGTGNFGNYPLYLGRRGSSTLPFNGRDYGIIVVGKTASATEISSTESYLAANTSGVSI